LLSCISNFANTLDCANWNCGLWEAALETPNSGASEDSEQLSSFRVGDLYHCAAEFDFAVFLELLRDTLIGFMD
jgi:hypothetical protein